MVEADPADAAFRYPTKFIGSVYGKKEADRIARDKGWAFRQVGAHLFVMLTDAEAVHVDGASPRRRRSGAPRRRRS